MTKQEGMLLFHSMHPNFFEEAAWYEKLGYRTSIRWTGKGIIR